MSSLKNTMMIGLVTAAAFFFTVCQIAASGSRGAQITLLLVGITFATFIAYAAFFLVGVAWDSVRAERRVGNKAMIPNTVPVSPSNTPGTPIRIVWILASLLSGSGIVGSGTMATADVNWMGIYPPGPKNLDYRLQVGLEKHSGPGGYNQLHLKFNPTSGVFAAEHNLTVTVSSHDDYKAQLSAATSQSFTLNQSTKGITEHMLIPYFCAATTLKLWITENGKEVARDKLPLYVGSNQFGYSGQRWTILIIDRETDDPPFPDILALTTVFGNDTTTSALIPEDSEKLRLSSKESRALAEQTQNAFLQFRVMPRTDLARQWLGFMPDAFGTYRNTNCAEYLDFYARSHGLVGRQRTARMRWVMDFTGLRTLSNRAACWPLDRSMRFAAMRQPTVTSVSKSSVRRSLSSRVWNQRNSSRSFAWTAAASTFP